MKTNLNDARVAETEIELKMKEKKEKKQAEEKRNCRAKTIT